MHLRDWAVLAMSGLYVGCGEHGQTTTPPAPVEKLPGTQALDSYAPAALATAEDVHTWAVMSSSPVVYFTPLPVFIALNFIDGIRDPTCPGVTTNILDSTTTGGCTAGDGTQWFGTMTVAHAAAGATTTQTTFTGFGYQKAVTTCTGQSGTTRLLLDGTMSVPVGQASTRQFTYNLRMDSSGLDSATCTSITRTVALEYEGSFQELSSDPSTSSRGLWEGSGRVGDSRLGVVTVSTRDEVLEFSVCPHEALSGTTTLQSGDHQALIQYDGATDCQEKSTVKWSLDGRAPADMEGVSENLTCSAASGAALPFWGLLGALGLVRRRVRR